LLAAYHTAYNVVGVAVLLPLIGWFTKFVERLLPDKGSPLTRGLDSAALSSPVVAAEAVRRTVAQALQTLCGSIEAALPGASATLAAKVGRSAPSGAEIQEALRKAQEFISEVCGPPETEDEQRRLTSTMHALDHASRLAELSGEQLGLPAAKGGPEDARAVELCAETMRNAGAVAREIADEAALSDHAVPITSLDTPDAMSKLAALDHAATALGELRRGHRSATLSAVAAGELTADQAMVRVDAVRRLEAFAHHAWRAAAHLAGRGG